MSQCRARGEAWHKQSNRCACTEHDNMTTSTGKPTKKPPPPRPAIYRRHSFDTCSLPLPASPASSPPSSPPRSPAPKTPDSSPKMSCFPELTASKSSATRSRRHTMSTVDGGYAKYDRFSGKMKMRLVSPPPPPLRKRQSIRVSGLLLPPPPSKMTEAEDSKKGEEKCTRDAPLQQHDIERTANASGMSSVARKFPALMPPRPPLEDDDDTEEPMEEDVSSGQRTEGMSDNGGNVRRGRRMSIGSILGPIVSTPPSLPPDSKDVADDDEKKPTDAEGDSTLPSLEGFHVSSKGQRNPQGPSPRSSAVL